MKLMIESAIKMCLYKIYCMVHDGKTVSILKNQGKTKMKENNSDINSTIKLMHNQLLVYYSNLMLYSYKYQCMQIYYQILLQQMHTYIIVIQKILRSQTPHV